jgi:ubiquinone/menaquinone biosynthesis C-methylase UbiE
MKATWMAGDFGQLANYNVKAAEEFVERSHIKSGDRVLDVACGTGNLAIPAAKIGAIVTGLDIAPNLLEQARKRAAAENVEIRFEEGDAEQLPYGDGEFDVVMTMFGAMFAPRPERVATELTRVCRPGGMIAMANWTPEGFIGKSFRVSSQIVPSPPGVPAPVLWGDEKVVRERLSEGTASLKMTRQKIPMHFPFSPKEVVAFFKEYFGPTKVAFSRLDEAGQADFAQRLETLWVEHNTAVDGTTSIEAEYLDVRAVRA